MRSGFIDPIRAALLPVGALLAMEAIWLLRSRQSDSFAPPSDIIVAFFGAVTDGTLLSATVETIAAAAIGALIGMVVGLVGGVAMGMFKSFGHATNLAVELLRPVPSVALVPIGILVFGLGRSLEVWIVAFACTWPMLLLSRSAISGIEPRLLEVARTLQLSMPSTASKIVIPAIIPNIIVAVRLCVTLALVVSITVEITANPLGIGFQMMKAQQSIRPDRMYAFLLWIAVLGWTLNFALVRIEQVILKDERERGSEP